MKRALAAAAMLVSWSALGTPAIEEDALKSALTRGKVKVVSLERQLGPPKVPDGSFARACQNWTLTEAAVLRFFSESTAISPDELRSSYSVLPCQYTGSISINGKPYQFSINIGRFGFIRTTATESAALFGCPDACRELFVIDVTAGT
jgi:hypothetical protein